MWSSSKQRVWEEKLPFDDPGSEDATISPRFDHYAIASIFQGRKTQYLHVDLNTGQATPIEGASMDVIPVDLQDGWMLYDSQPSSSGRADTVTLLNPDGSAKETFEVGVPDDFTDYPWSPQDLDRRAHV